MLFLLHVPILHSKTLSWVKSPCDLNDSLCQCWFSGWQRNERWSEESSCSFQWQAESRTHLSFNGSHLVRAWRRPMEGGRTAARVYGLKTHAQWGLTQGGRGKSWTHRGQEKYKERVKRNLNDCYSVAQCCQRHCFHCLSLETCHQLFNAMERRRRSFTFGAYGG